MLLGYPLGHFQVGDMQLPQRVGAGGILGTAQIVRGPLIFHGRGFFRCQRLHFAFPNLLAYPRRQCLQLIVHGLGDLLVMVQ